MDGVSVAVEEDYQRVSLENDMILNTKTHRIVEQTLGDSSNKKLWFFYKLRWTMRLHDRARNLGQLRVLPSAIAFPSGSTTYGWRAGTAANEYLQSPKSN